jgi:anti-sigma factor RsiW
MECNQAGPLIPSYLDGELSEAQAGPLRRHLLDCHACRSSAQSGKNLKRWFVKDDAVAIPRDFAARVARRAFAGDRGERYSDMPTSIAAARTDDGRSLNFILQLTSLAAVLLIALSLALGNLKLPSGVKLQAQPPETTLERAIEDLDRLNAKDATRPAASVPATSTRAPAGARIQPANGGNGAAAHESKDAGNRSR